MVEFDWLLRVPTEDHRAGGLSTPIEMTAYISVERPRGRLDPEKARKWVADLDSDSLQTRQAASRELEGLGASVKPMLGEVLKSSPSPEARRRLQAILDGLRGAHTGELEIPDGVTVLTAGDMVEEYMKGLNDPNPM